MWQEENRLGVVLLYRRPGWRIRNDFLRPPCYLRSENPNMGAHFRAQPDADLDCPPRGSRFGRFFLKAALPGPDARKLPAD